MPDPLALKATWEVRAGVVPGTAIPEYTKCFTYTADEYETDGAHATDPAYQPIFMLRMAEAGIYQLQLSNPKLVNWAELTFFWY